jgi:hypothetical protein
VSERETERERERERERETEQQREPQKAKEREKDAHLTHLKTWFAHNTNVHCSQHFFAKFFETIKTPNILCYTKGTIVAPLSSIIQSQLSEHKFIFSHESISLQYAYNKLDLTKISCLSNHQDG